MSAETGHLAGHLNGVAGNEKPVGLVKGKVVGRKDELIHDDSFRRVHAIAGDPHLKMTVPASGRDVKRASHRAIFIGSQFFVPDCLVLSIDEFGLHFDTGLQGMQTLAHVSFVKDGLELHLLSRIVGRLVREYLAERSRIVILIRHITRVPVDVVFISLVEESVLITV